MNLVIDPGHGGPDTGAVGHGIVESEMTWALASKLAGAAWVGVGGKLSYAMTRTEKPEARVGLTERGRRSDSFAADLVIAIHVNASIDPRSSGLMTFYWPGSLDGFRVAKAIHAARPVALNHRPDPYAATIEAWPRVRNVLRVHKAPAVLVEVGFLTNELEAANLKDPGVQDEIIRALLAGIEEFSKAREV